MPILKSLIRLHRCSKGQATAEFIILTPLIIVLFLIVVDFSLLLRDWIMVSNAAREGARYGALGGSIGPSEITDRVVATSDGLAQAGDVTVGYVDGPDGPAGTGDRGDSVVVRTSRDYTFPILSNIFPGIPPVPIRTCVDMRLEVAAATAPGGTQC